MPPPRQYSAYDLEEVLDGEGIIRGAMITGTLKFDSNLALFKWVFNEI